MTPVTILAKARRLYNVDTTQYSDADMLSDLNELKNDFQLSLITAVEEKWNWDIWTTTSVALTSEYEIPEVSSSAVGAKQIKQVSISYDGETYEGTGKMIYVPCTEVNPDTLPMHWGYYEENQSTDNPIFFVADNHIFIAPAPTATQAGANRIELRGIKSIADYTLATTEAEMKYPVDIQSLFIQGLEPYAMRTKGMDRGEINAAISEYERRKVQKIKEMTTRYETATFFTYPDDLSDNDTI